MTVFSDGFESGSFNGWGWTAGSPAMVSSPVHSGSYAASASGPSCYWHKDVGTGYSDLFFAGYVCVPAMLANGQMALLMYILDSSYNQVVAGGLQVNGSGDKQWVLRVNSTYYTVSATIQTGQWYFMEIEYNTNGTAKLWIDGTQMYNATGQTLNSNPRLIQGGNPSSGTPSGFVNYGDDYITDTSFISCYSDLTAKNIVLDKVLTFRGENGEPTNIKATVAPLMDKSQPALEVEYSLLAEDIQAFGFLGSKTDPVKGTGGGAILMGHGFTSAADEPTFLLTDTMGNGSGATATLTVNNGVITAVNVTNQGNNYTFADVTVNSTSGSGARLATVINGKIQSIDVVNGGVNYSSSDTVTITGNGSGATATLTVVGGIITAVNVTNQGNYYTYAIVTVNSSTGSGAILSRVINGKIQSINIVGSYGGGKNYSSSDTVNITNTPHNTLYLRQIADSFGSTSPANLNIGSLAFQANAHPPVVLNPGFTDPYNYIYPSQLNGHDYTGLGTSNYPFAWLDATTVFTETVNSIHGAGVSLADTLVDTGCTADATGVQANHFCSITDDNKVGVSNRYNATRLHGVATATVGSGGSVRVIKMGRAQVVAGENLSAGDRVTTDQNGCAIKFSGHNHDLNGHTHGSGSISVSSHTGHTHSTPAHKHKLGYADATLSYGQTNNMRPLHLKNSQGSDLLCGAALIQTTESSEDAYSDTDGSGTSGSGADSNHTVSGSTAGSSAFTGTVATGEPEYKVLVGANTGYLATIWVQ